MSKIAVQVEEATASAPVDARRLRAVGRLIDRLVRPGVDGPLIALFQTTSAEADKAGRTEDEIRAAYNAERRV